MENYIWHDVRNSPFSIHGLLRIEEHDTLFRRIPKEVAENTNDGVKWHSKVPAGGRVRFKTDSEKLGIRVKTNESGVLWCGTPQFHFGCDLYIDGAVESAFAGCTRFELNTRSSYEWEFALPKGEKELTLFLPCHAFIQSLEIGILPEATLGEHRAYRYQKPIVYYGSSITQGIAACRPGRGYTAQISRKLDHDYVDLGFSGSCKAEPAILDYMAGLEMSAFVCDYDHNAPNAQYLKETHYNVYEAIRKKHPDIPFYMISRPDFSFKNINDVKSRVVVMESYLKAFGSGDRNVYFIDGTAFFNGYELMDCTVDCTHPNDLGTQRMAEYIGDVLKKTLPL